MARPKKKLILISTQLAVVAALILGLIGFVGNNKTVAVNVDGQTQEVSTFASDVRGVLESGDIELAAGDEITPSLDDKVTSETVISIATNKEIQLEIDGETKSYNTTATTLAEFLDGIELKKNSEIAADLDAELVSFTSPIAVTTPKSITVVQKGKKNKSFTSTEPTIGEALKAEGIKLTKKHKLFEVTSKKASKGKKAKTVNKALKPEAKLEKATKVMIQLHSTKTDKETVAVPFQTKTTKDSSLYEGDKKVKTQGVAGSKTITYKLTLVDGKVTDKVKTDETVTKKPVDSEVLVGTKKRPTPKPTPKPAQTQTQTQTQTQKKSSTTSAPAPKANTTNVGGAWQKLAQCESGGNWSINTGNGYYGGLQFSAGSWAAAGGTKYAALPHQATPAQQIATAERLRANGGWGHWPACSARLGLR